MLFTEFREKNCRKSGFSDAPVLSSEQPVPDRGRCEISESPVKSGETELFQAFLTDSVLIPQLEEFFEIVGGLTDQGPRPVPSQPVPQASAEAPQIPGDGDEPLRGRPGLPAVVTFLLSHVGASSHEHMEDLFRRVSAEIRQAAESGVGHDRDRASGHPFYINFKCFRIKSFVIGTAGEVLSGYHEAVPVECQLQGRPELAVRVTLSLFYRSGVGIVGRDDAVLYMQLPGKLQHGLLFENIQKVKRCDCFLFPLGRSPRHPDFC